MPEAQKPLKTIQVLNKIADQVVECIFTVHRTMGPGFAEGIYESCLKEEFKSRGLNFQSQVDLPVYYMGKKLDKVYRLDLIIENEIIIELKVASEILPVHKAQRLSYMKQAGKCLGYVANFNVALMKDGIKRMRLDDATEYEKRNK